MLPHEVRLYKAMSKLNRFSPSLHHQPVVSDEELGSSLGAALMGGPTGANRPKQSWEDQLVYHNAYAPLQNASGPPPGMDPERDDVIAGRAVPRSIQDVGKDTVAQVQDNETSDNTRFGGRYTPGGLDEAGKEADANAADRMNMRALVSRYSLGAPPMVR